MSDSFDRFGLDVEVVGPLVVVAVSGELDMSTAPAFAKEIDSALSTAPDGLIVDFTDVGFLGSSAITVLFSALDNAGKTTTIAVVADGPATRRPLDLVGLSAALSVYPTRAAALKSLPSA